MDFSIEAKYAYAIVWIAFLAIIVSIVFSISFMCRRIGLWGLFSKADEKEWKSIVPVYNQITLLKICKLNPWFVLLYVDLIIPMVGYLAGRDVKWITIIMLVGLLIYRFMIAIRLGQAYKRGDVFSFFTAFFPSIFFPILGCSKKMEYSEVVIKKKK